MAFFIKVFLLIFVITAYFPVFACDSTLLAILSGNDLQDSYITKFLSISDKLVAEGEMLNSYNIANARKQHSIIMNEWLKLITEIGNAPMVAEKNKNEFRLILSEIAKDLGRVRKQLAKENYINLHEIIEASVTKISILAAIIKENTVIYDFLKFELAIYTPGIFLDKPEEFLTHSYLSGVETTLNSLSKSFAQQAKSLSEEFLTTVKVHRKTIEEIKNNKIAWEKSTLSYNKLKNSFVALKQQLLKDNYLK